MILTALLVKDAPLVKCFAMCQSQTSESIADTAGMTAHLMHHIFATGPFSTPIGTAILATCLQLHAEGASILYSGNSFLVVRPTSEYNRKHPLRMLDGPAPRYVPCIKQATISIPASSHLMYDLVGSIPHWPNLQKLDICASWPTFREIQMRLSTADDREAAFQKAVQLLKRLINLRKDKIPANLQLRSLRQWDSCDRPSKFGKSAGRALIATYPPERQHEPDMDELLQAGRDIMSKFKKMR